MVITKIYLILCLLLFCSHNTSPSCYADPCEEAKTGSEAATALAKTSVFETALISIQAAFLRDGNEHAIAFGKDAYGNVITSAINTGEKAKGIIPGISNAFTDLHNHPGIHPPDAGDLYGLIDISQKQKQKHYNTRFVLTQNKTIYALVVTNDDAAAVFNIRYPRDIGGCCGCSPKFPEAIVDEFREIKYVHGCTDEMALAFILEKYNAGISLLKQNSKGSFHKLRTSVSKNGNTLSFTPNNCQ